MRASGRGSLFEKYDITIFNKLPHAVRHDLVVREIATLTRFQVNVILLVDVMAGLNQSKLMSYFRAGETSNAILSVYALANDGYLREERVIGKSRWLSSRKFYLTGKGKEIVRVYYELMNG